ncbi:hypothetical protein FQN54_008946 [Arachnomyces sp. PD_36]|nr:hypothetical protein FQN54_008946 [Arachnomyces sp. PD_36]
MSTETVNNKEPWLSFLEKEYLWCEKGTVQRDVSSALKDMFLSTDHDNAAHTAAHQFNTYYWERVNKRQSFKWGKREPWVDYISFLYQIIVRLAPVVRYDDVRQDILVQLIVELRNLPPNPVKGPYGDRLAPPSDNMLFAQIVDEYWRGLWGKYLTSFTFSPSGTKSRDGERNIDIHLTASSNWRFPEPAQWKQRCDEWLNLSCFIARCVQARLDDELFLEGSYPFFAIEDGLKGNIDDPIKRDCWVLIAAQYFLLAAPALDEEFIQRPTKKNPDWGVDKWKYWAKRFGELEGGTLLAPEVKRAVADARKKMISLRPELFTVSEGGAKPEE